MSKPQTQRNNTTTEKPPLHHRSNSKNHGRRPSNENKNGNGSFKSSTNGGGANGHTIDTGVLQNESFQNHQQDRMLYLIMNSIGAEINVLTNSGSTLNGSLENIDPKSLRIVMKTGSTETVTVNYEDLIDFEILNVDLFNNSIVKNSGSFKTDTDISKKGATTSTSTTSSTQRRQDIEKWVPDSSTPIGLSLEDMSLENSNGRKVKWDQFETNEQKFGIKSEFDEHLYTTRINKADPEYQKRLLAAERLAREIESGGTENSHLAEERGIKFDDSGLDEEDKYSGVARKSTKNDTKGNAKGDALFASLINKGQDNKSLSFSAEDKSTKYVPPSQRSRIQNIDPSIISATNIPAVKKATSPPPAALTANAETPLIDSKLDSGKSSISSASTSTTTSTSTASTTNNAANPKLPAKPNVPDKAKAYEHAKKINAMNEINSLKEFSQNFKLPSKFPQDLLPIITKDKIKQDEIIKKSEISSNKSSPKATTVVTEKPVVQSQIGQAQTQAPTPTPAAHAKPVFSSVTDVSSVPIQTTQPVQPTVTKRTESVKKLNPKAAAFTPSGFVSPSPSMASPNFSKSSPRISQVNYRAKKFNQQSFFAPDRVPSADKKKRSLDENYNFFKGCLKLHQSDEEKSKTPFVLEKPFITPPTWSRDDLERPYKKFFPDIDLSKIPPIPQLQQPQHQIPPYQTMPMMQPPQMFYGGPQFPPMRMSPQLPHQQLPQQQPLPPQGVDGNFMAPPPPQMAQQRMQPMYMQPGMPMNGGPGPMPYQRYPQGGYPGQLQPGPMPQMMAPPLPPGGRIMTGYKNHH